MRDITKIKYAAHFGGKSEAIGPYKTLDTNEEKIIVTGNIIEFLDKKHKYEIGWDGQYLYSIPPIVALYAYRRTDTKDGIYDNTFDLTRIRTIVKKQNASLVFQGFEII